MAAAAAEGAEGGQGGGLDPADPYSEAEIASMMVRRALDDPALLEAEEQSQEIELAARGDAASLAKLSTRGDISNETTLEAVDADGFFVVSQELCDANGWRRAAFDGSSGTHAKPCMALLARRHEEELTACSAQLRAAGERAKLTAAALPKKRKSPARWACGPSRQRRTRTRARLRGRRPRRRTRPRRPWTRRPPPRSWPPSSRSGQARQPTCPVG